MPNASPEVAFAQARHAYEQALANLNRARAALAVSRAGASSVPLELDSRVESCSFPPHANFTHWPHPDVRQPTAPCPAETRPPPTSSLEALRASGHTSEVAVLPSLLVPCCAHSGTTFLWRCMQYAFHPQRVCGRVSQRKHNPNYAGSVHEWTSSACPDRKYLLPGLTGNIEGHWDYRKEWFFYGGGGASWQKGWAEYVGVRLPLCYWEPEFQRLLRAQPLDDTLAHSRRLCQPPKTSGLYSADQRDDGGNGGNGNGGGAVPRCTHRACMPLDLDKVRLSPTYAPEYDRRHKPRWQFQASKALPRVHPSVHTGAVVSDMTPNYLCSPKSLRNLASSIGAPAHYRLLILHRSPLSMINASYRMFIQWGWVRVGHTLETDVLSQLSSLAKCNQTLYDHPELLARLSADEVLTYFGRCWRGTWRDFVTNSMPYVCLRAWVAAGFRKHQFMLVPQSRLRSAGAETLLTQLANFTGLHYNRQVLQDKRVELGAQCEAPPGARAAGAASSSNVAANYTGRNAVRRTQLSAATHAELLRLASAHTKLLEGLGVRELA